MKHIIMNRQIILFLAVLLSTGCSNKPKLEKEKALQLIAIEFKYPRVIDYEIYCSDPAHAKKLLDAGFAANGLVTIKKTQKLKDMGSPLIGFTDKAKPYVLPTRDKDKKLDIQKVKIAEEVITDVTIVATEGQYKTVEYTTGYKNITPFSTLLNTDFKKPKKHTVHFTSSDNGWILQQSLR
jgi:hypothetical protein